MAVKEVQREDGIQQPPVCSYGGCPIEVLQAADLFEACLLQMDFHISVISAGDLIRQDYLKKGGIVQLVAASQR
jgi:hypothetical protein